MATPYPVLLKIDGTDYDVVKVDGRERLSHPWQFDVEFVSRDKAVTLDKLRKDKNCPVCGTHPTVTKLIDYEEFCGLRGGHATDAPPEPAGAPA